MTEQEIKDKAKDVYIRCFDDDINYPCVLESLEIAIRESTEEKIADLKANFDYVLEGKDLEIKELGTRCNQLLKDKGDFTDKVQELEQQIEKMKRHCNCKHRDGEGYCEVKRIYLMDLSYDGCDKWELEND